VLVLQLLFLRQLLVLVPLLLQQLLVLLGPQ
jgi:hypothetical protein